MSILLKQPTVLPGFGLTLGFTLFYLSLIVLIPLAGLFVKTSALTWEQFWQAVADPRTVASYQLTFGLSFVAALINAFFGVIIAWVLVRYSFPGKKFVDALVDLPFALPTAVAGIALTLVGVAAVVLAPVWIPVLALIGLIALVKRIRRTPAVV